MSKVIEPDMAYLRTSRNCIPMIRTHDLPIPTSLLFLKSSCAIEQIFYLKFFLFYVHPLLQFPLSYFMIPYPFQVYSLIPARLFSYFSVCVYPNIFSNLLHSHRIDSTQFHLSLYSKNSAEKKNRK